MKITRRELLISAGSLLAYSQLGSLANAEVNIASQPGDQEMIASMCKALYPHDRFPMNIYICLLYTSPSPRDLSTSRMPSSA